MVLTLEQTPLVQSASLEIYFRSKVLQGAASAEIVAAFSELFAQLWFRDT